MGVFKDLEIDLANEIEEEKEILNQMIVKIGFKHPEILKQSQKLDKLIVKYIESNSL